MKNTWSITRREFAGYFATPVAYVFIVIFLFFSGVFTFQFGSLFERGQADLRPFFGFLPWIFLVFIPAIAMRLWAEERRLGTIELLMTLPISVGQAVVGKFLAAWAFSLVALALTFPYWMTLCYLGDPDQGAIVAAYVGSALLAGGFLAISSFVSALTKNQVIAFVISVPLCFLFMLSDFEGVSGFVREINPVLHESFLAVSILEHFQALSRGVIDLRDLLFFGSLIVFFLFANTVVLELKKAD